MNRSESWGLGFAATAALVALTSWLIADCLISSGMGQRNAACARVLECLDLGAERDHCNALFPGCESRSPEGT